MKDYTNENPIFSESIRVTETSDPAHADNINMGPIQVFQNTLFNRNSIEKIKKGMGDKEEYNADHVYQAGDYCQYQGILYKCVQDTDGEWNPECWKQTNAIDEISDINTPTFEDYCGEGAEVPGAREAIARIQSKKGLTSIISNIKAALMGLVTLGEIRGLLVNNGLCSEAGKFFLDAAYGKNLQDQLTKLNSDLQYIDLKPTDTILDFVVRHKNDRVVGFMRFGSMPQDIPDNNEYFVISEKDGSKDRIKVILLPLDTENRRTYIRKVFRDTWRDPQWTLYEYASKSDLPALEANAKNISVGIDDRERFWFTIVSLSGIWYSLNVGEEGIRFMKNSGDGWKIVWSK